MTCARSILLAATVCGVALGFGQGALPATEYGATHLVFEKKTKMKKVSARLFMSFLDQSASGDRAGNRRSLRCVAMTSVASGAVPAKGEFVVRVVGETVDAGAPWSSSALAEPVDGRGEARFGEDAILDLVAEADEDGADLDLFLIEFDGGKGKAVAAIAIDCIHELTGG